MNKFFTTQDAKRRRLEEELNRANQSADRLQGFIDERADLYERFFDLIIEQCNILTELYGPLKARLQAAVGSASKLSLKVVRQVDVEA